LGESMAGAEAVRHRLAFTISTQHELHAGSHSGADITSCCGAVYLLRRGNVRCTTLTSTPPRTPRNPVNRLAVRPLPRPSLALASIRAQALLPTPEPASPMPPEVDPPPLDIPPEVPPEIREPDLPGEHIPISDNPRLQPPMGH
jgi:hypothetical protein